MDGFNINKLLFNLQQSTEWLRKVKNNNKTQNLQLNKQIITKY